MKFFIGFVLVFTGGMLAGILLSRTDAEAFWTWRISIIVFVTFSMVAITYIRSD